MYIYICVYIYIYIERYSEIISDDTISAVVDV